MDLTCRRSGVSPAARVRRRCHRHRRFAAPPTSSSVPGGDYVSHRRRDRGLRRSRHDRGGNHRRRCRIPARPRPSAASHPTPRSSAFASPATDSGRSTMASGAGFRRRGDSCDGSAHRGRLGRDGDQRVLGRMRSRRDPLDDRALGAALAYAVDVKNVVVVAAAGNVGGTGPVPGPEPPPIRPDPGQPDWTDLNGRGQPAWYDDYVLTVGSVEPLMERRRRSASPGPWVDVAAPGEGVVSLDPDGEGLIDAPLHGRRRCADLGDELCRAGGRAGSSRWSASRSPELTARQVMQRIEDDRPPPRRRLGSGRGQWCRRCARRGDRRRRAPSAPARANPRNPVSDSTPRTPRPVGPRRVALRRRRDLPGDVRGPSR